MLWALDLALRFVYVALVPFLLPIINLFMPIAGLLAGTALATIIALIGSDLWRRKVERLKYIGRPLSGMGRLGDFYREYPPKPLVYYIFYPVLLPVILFMRVPRREFFLFRKMNVLAMLVIAATAVYDYFAHWRPELGAGQFLGATTGMMVMQMIVTFMLIMPVVTTLVMFRQRRSVTTLSALVTFMVASASYSAYRTRHAHPMTIMTAVRLEERTKYARAELKQCEQNHPDAVRDCVRKDPQIRAMGDALEAVVKSEHDDPRDDAVALEAAQTKLAGYYKPDEAAAFRLAAADKTLVIYARRGRKPAICWLGMQKGKFFVRPAQLPEKLRQILGV